ncbi:hypothetical protein, partial [Phocaeicola plebeius]|uniref:hypothetical protein n=1 Tax=Phocaeicola plebeius TaxID=310297 RepID=UPI0026EE56AA
MRNREILFKNMIINEVLYISGAFLLSLKKDPEFAPDKLRRNTIFCILPKTKKEAVSNLYCTPKVRHKTFGVFFMK